MTQCKHLLFTLVLLFLIFGAHKSIAEIPEDSHPCYDPDSPFTWCNIIGPGQHFSRYFFADRLRWATVTVGSTAYQVQILINYVYDIDGPIPQCDSASATPAYLYNTWICASNVGYPYYQNWDACANGLNKLMLYCYPVAGCIQVSPRDLDDTAVAEFLDSYLDNYLYMLIPSSTAPQLDPLPASLHVYAKRPSFAGQACPDYDQPYGCD
jgi:hypothetical protein